MWCEKVIEDETIGVMVDQISLGGQVTFIGVTNRRMGAVLHTGAEMTLKQLYNQEAHPDTVDS